MGFYDEIELEDMDWNEELQGFTYSCPCGDLFQITVKEMLAGEDIGRCPSCSLFIQVIYDQDEITAKHGQRSGHQDGQPPPIAVA